jgi:hypothetical protein
MSIISSPEGSGRILVTCWCWIVHEWRNCELLSANPTAQTAQVIRLNALCQCQIPYHQIASVSLAYQDGTIIDTWGAPIADALAQFAR